MRRGFGVVYAVIIMLLVSTIGIYSLELSSKSVKSVSNEHFKIQLRLYMNSSVEYVLLWLSRDQNRSQNSADLNISYEGGRYFFRMHAEPVPSQLPESNGTMLLDAVGRFDSGGSEPLVVTKRLLIKP